MYLQNSQLLFRLKSARTEEDAQGVDDAGDVAKDGQQDVDEEVGIATALEENTKRRQDDGEDDFDDVAAIVLAGADFIALRHTAAGRCAGERANKPSGERHDGDF